jgi:hypothetical protein
MGACRKVLNFKITTLFFDSAKVIRAVGKAQAMALSKGGAIVKGFASRLLRYRKKKSAPGQPPSMHGGQVKKFLFFGYDPGSGSVVIGPEKLGTRATPVPSVLEFGGSTKHMRRRRRGGRAAVVSKVAPRPYMGPALEQAAPLLPEPWANSVRGK